MEIFFNWNVCSLKLKQCFQKLKAVQKTRKVLKKVEELMHGAGPGQRWFSAGMKLNAVRLRLDLLLALVRYC